MNDDLPRDGGSGRAPADFSEPLARRPDSTARRPGAADRSNATQPGPGGQSSQSGLPAPLPNQDEDAIARHRAAKQARVRKRREEMRSRQANAEAPEAQTTVADIPHGSSQGDGQNNRGAGQGMKRGAKGSALPALRPDIKPDTPALRAERVEAIRRDLVRRRRRKGSAMLVKLFLFVAMPTIAVGWFLWFAASDLYRSESKFRVESADMGGGGAGGLLGSLFGGGSLSDPVAVQTYLTSRDVLARLDAEHSWIAHFQNPELDFYHRLDADATLEQSFRHYLDMVSVSYDPTEGIIEMSLIAADPANARRFSLAIIGYAEEMVDQLSKRIRTDAMADAQANFDAAEWNLHVAQLAQAQAQKVSAVFSVESEVAAQMALVSQLEAARETAKAKLASLLGATSEADPRVKRKRAAIANLDRQVEDLRARIAGSASGEQTLADINARMVTSRLDVQTKMAIFTSALERLEIARADATRQHRYLSVVARPSLPDLANYPRKPEMTTLAFLAFLGFYIIGSLTLSLIREQASI